jgi:hypothetical protein
MNRQLRLGPISAVLMLAALSTSANVALSERAGRLASAPLYDDVVYLLDAANRYLSRQNDGLLSWLGSFVASPPHSPLSTITAMLGYALFGVNVVAPYLANSAILVTFLLALLTMASRTARLAPQILLPALMLLAPVSHAMISEFRPDMGAGLLLAIVSYSICQTDLNVASNRRLVFIGLASALAIIAKPSAVVITIPVIGLAATLSVATHFGSMPTQRLATRILLPVALCLLLVIPFGIVWGPNVYGYLIQVFVTNADVWKTPGSIEFHALYHSFGAGGRIAMGPFFIVGLVFIAWDFAVSAATFRLATSKRALSYYLLLSIIYAGMSLTSEKSVFQGSFFYLPFLLGAVSALLKRTEGLAVAWQRINLTTMVLSVLLVLAILNLPIASSYTPFREIWQGNLKLQTQLLAAVRAKIVEQSALACGSRAITFTTLAPDPIPPDAVALAAAYDGISVNTIGPYFARSAGDMLNMARTADLVLIPGPAYVDPNSQLPGLKFIPELEHEFSVDSAWRQLPISSAPDHPLKLFIKTGC